MDHPVNGRGGGHGVGEDVLPLGEDQGAAFVAFGNQGKEHLGLLGALGQVAQVVEQQEVEGVQLAQLAGQGQVAFGGQQVLYQPVGWGKEDGMARFHQASEKTRTIVLCDICSQALAGTIATTNAEYDEDGALVICHYAPYGKETACGMDVDAGYSSWTDDPALVKGCSTCQGGGKGTNL